MFTETSYLGYPLILAIYFKLPLLAQDLYTLVRNVHVAANAFSLMHEKLFY